MDGLDDLPEEVQEIVSLAGKLNAARLDEAVLLIRALVVAQNKELEQVRADLERQTELLSFYISMEVRDYL